MNLLSLNTISFALVGKAKKTLRGFLRILTLGNVRFLFQKITRRRFSSSM
jgi:hypothetical protein